MKVRLPNGMGGGPSIMQSMIKQAQKMQEEMAEKQAELEACEYDIAAVGGFAVGFALIMVDSLSGLITLPWLSKFVIWMNLYGQILS